MTPEQARVAAILMPEAYAKLCSVQESDNCRFVHYTTAEVAVSIIKDRGIWMRNAYLMNDYSEVRHGSECFFYAWRGEAGFALRNAMARINPDLPARFDDEYFENFSRNLQNETYLTSFCEHRAEPNNHLGRLSMWRAYGGDSGVAIVVNKDVFLKERGVLGLYYSPVAYWHRERVAEEMFKIAAAIMDNLDAFSSFDLARLYNQFSIVFMAAVLCTKHPGFEEEAEWRVFYNSRFQTPPMLDRQVKVIRGIPQIVYRLKFRAAAEPDNGEISIPDMLDRLLIGPCPYIFPVYLGLVQTLKDAGVPNSDGKVFASGIPLRR